MRQMQCTFVRADRDRQEGGDIFLLVEVVLRCIKGTGNLCPVVTFPSSEVLGRGSKSLQISQPQGLDKVKQEQPIIRYYKNRNKPKFL